MIRTSSTVAPHPAGELAAASDDLAEWLAPWVKDQAEGATVNEILALLVETTRDPTLLTWEYLAERGVVHPGEFIRYNRDRFELTEDDESWVIRHKDDGRTPLRVRRGEITSWELVEPMLDDAGSAP